MNRISFSKKALIDIPSPKKGRLFVYDIRLNGLSLCVTGSGHKSFYVRRRVEGRSVRKKLGTFPDMAVEQARRIGSKVLADMAAGIDPINESRKRKISHMTVQKVFDDYMNARSGRLSHNTISNYNTILGSHLKAWKNKSLKDISRADVMKKHKQLSEISQSSANKSMRLLSALFNFSAGVYDQQIVSNPVQVLTHNRSWNKERRRNTLLRSHEICKWFEAVGNRSEEGEYASMIADYLTLILYTGLRRREAASLTRSQLDFADRSFTIKDTKNGKELLLPMSKTIEQILKRRVNRTNSEYIFPGDGKSGYINDPRKEIAAIREASELSFTLHDLRRTFITTADSIDMSAYALKALVNHSSGWDVTAGYIIMTPDRLREPMQRITDKINELRKQHDS